MDVEDDWPPKIHDKIATLAEPGKTIGAGLHGGPESDVTADSIKLIEEFAPDVKILGLQLLLEKEHFAGVLYRAVKKEDDSKRCLQYIYVYTKQFGAVNPLWMIIIPLLMGLWGMFVRTNFVSEILLLTQAIENCDYISLLPFGEAGIPLFITGGVWTPILLAGLAPHIGDYFKMPKGHWFYARNTTLLIPFGILTWFIPFSSLIPSILIGSAIACLAYYALEWRKIAKSAHDMDYAPVFVWVREYTSEEKQREEERKNGKRIPKEKNKAGHWKFDSACWDYYHYLGVTREEKDMKTNWGIYTAKYLKDEKRVRLLMANTWHSFFLGSQIIQFFRASLIIFPLLLIIGFLFISSGNYSINYPTSAWWMILLGFFIVLSGRTAARFPFSLVKDWSKLISFEKLEENPYYLSAKKLRVLWNLEEKQARFAIISKMQNPFHLRSDFYATFRDEPEYLLYDYGVTDRLKELELELGEATMMRFKMLINQGYVESAASAAKQVEQSMRQMAETNPADPKPWRILERFEGIEGYDEIAIEAKEKRKEAEKAEKKRKEAEKAKKK